MGCTDTTVIQLSYKKSDYGATLRAVHLDRLGRRTDSRRRYKQKQNDKKNVERAIQCLEIAVDRDPGHLQSRFQLGLGYYQTGRLASAARQFERCLQNHAPFPELLNNLGAVYSALERWDKAIDCFETFIEPTKCGEQMIEEFLEEHREIRLYKIKLKVENKRTKLI